MTGELEGEVFANEAAQSFPDLARGERLPPGAVLAELHHARAQTDGPAVVFVMIKQAAGFFREGGDWEYLIVDAAGTIEQRGRLLACARCHAEAPSDHVFGRRHPP